jgi:hypothetical protein
VPRLSFARYVPVPLDLIDAIERDEIRGIDAAVIVLLSILSQHAGTPGVVRTTISDLASRFGGIGLKTIRASLQRLEASGRIKSFRDEGRHGRYPLVIDGFIANQDGVQRRIHAAKTTDPRAPKWTACPRDFAEMGASRTGERRLTHSTPPLTPSEKEGVGEGVRGAPHYLDVESRDTPLPPDEAAQNPKRFESGVEPPKGGTRPDARSPDPIATLREVWRECADRAGVGDESGSREFSRAIHELLVFRKNDVDACAFAIRAFFNCADPIVEARGRSIAAFKLLMRRFAPAPEIALIQRPPPASDEPPVSPECAARMRDQFLRGRSASRGDK